MRAQVDYNVLFSPAVIRCIHFQTCTIVVLASTSLVSLCMGNGFKGTKSSKFVQVNGQPSFSSFSTTALPSGSELLTL